VTGETTRKNSTDDPEIQRAILTHLAAHPRGDATREGILEWWVMERALERETRRVERALAALVEAGWLRRRRDPDGTITYRIPPERRERVSTFELHSSGRGSP
jgi:hypothetical protein